METTKSSSSVLFRVGVFTLFGLALTGAMTVFVNDKPYWWRKCQLVHVKINDATGLKAKSPVRSLGLEIGYLQSVELSETFVRLGICITAPVEVLPATRAYIQGEGFLGDKFLELKPVRYTGPRIPDDDHSEGLLKPALKEISRLLLRNALAEDVIVAPSVNSTATSATSSAPLTKDLGSESKPEIKKDPKKGLNPEKNAKSAEIHREIPIGEKSQDLQHVIEQVDNLVGEMTSLTNNLKEAINPQELRQTMQQLNKTLENASKTFSPEGGLNTTARRTLSKLEDAIEQMRDQMTRINKGEGSVGMLLNDPSYAKDLGEAFKNVNRLLTKVGGVRFVVDVGAENIPAFDGSRGWFKMQVWAKPDRYYLLGISIDPRGKRSVTTTTTDTSAGATVNPGHTETTETKVEQSGILLTGMLGKIFLNRIDLSIGVLHGDGAASAGFWLGPKSQEQMFVLKTDLFSRGQGTLIDGRVNLIIRPMMSSPLLSAVYFQGGIDSIRKNNGKLVYSVGTGLSFDDDDIKLLFAFR